MTDIPTDLKDRATSQQITPELLDAYDASPALLADAAEWIENNYAAVASVHETDVGVDTGYEIVAIPKHNASSREASRAVDNAVHKVMEWAEEQQDEETGIRSGKGSGFFSRTFLE